MKEIFITGHRNPDLDSICSAYGYAVLKNMIDKDNTYTAVRCGHLSDVLKKQFEFIGITPPPYLSNIYPKVDDVMINTEEKVESSEPIFNLVKAYSEKRPTVFPVYEKGKFKGLLSIDDITSFFLRDNSEEVPVYSFTPENISAVIPGTLIQRGEKEKFDASLLAGAAAFNQFQAIITPDSKNIVVMGQRKKYVEFAMSMGVPAVIITTSSSLSDIDISSYKGLVYVTKLGTAETLRRLRMASEVGSIMNKETISFQVSDNYDEAKNTLSESKLRGISVYDGKVWKGYVTSRCFLNKPRHSVILVDHNEEGQSIKGIEDAEILEIIDHHRLDALKTAVPLFVDSEPVGSTCTIIYQMFLRHNIVPDEQCAKVLLMGVISDTLILKSPTTTALDRATAGALAAISGEYDVHSFGEKLFSFTDSLSSKDAEEAISSDFKTYNEKGIKLGIGQCEVTTLKDFSEYSDRYLKALEKIRKKNSLDWAMLMITDVLRDKSILLTTESKLNKALQWNKIKNNVYDMPGVMSRKKQVLPEVLYSLD